MGLMLALMLPQARSAGVKFTHDDPIWVDPDRLSIPEPRVIELSKAYDLLENTFTHAGGGPVPARNINSVGEVPDSSWFTNRITGPNAVSTGTLARGSEGVRSPDPAHPWMVTALKHEGITPGLTIRDARGDRYILKFDPLHHPQMATSTEVVSTRFFHAFGYNVPDNSLVLFEPGRLQVAPEASVTEPGGRRRRLLESDLRATLRNVPGRPDGTVQAMASLYVTGKPIGPFKYYGTRSDDPNDVFPHEDRRELRALRVFDAWLNHNDSDAVNTLDSYVEEEGRRFVRHYLIDFGTTLGSGAFEPKALRAGNEYYLQPWPVLRSAVTLGILDREWRGIHYPNYPSIGRFEADHFDPAQWKPDYPNPAHDRLAPADSLWAVRILMRFDDESIRRFVSAGHLTDKDAEEYLVRVLVARRDKLVRYYLGVSNPLDGFLIGGNGAGLDFRDLAAEAGFAAVDRAYEYQWFTCDNETGAGAPLSTPQTATNRTLPIPAGDAPLMRVRLRTVARDYPAWHSYIDVFIRNAGDRKIVGIERES